MEQAQKLRFTNLWSRKARVLFWVFGTGCGVLVVCVTLFVVFLGTQAFALQSSMQEVRRALGDYDLSSAQIALEDASDHAVRLERTLSLVSFFTYFPYVGDTYTAVLQSLRVAQEGFSLGHDMLVLASSVTDAIDRAQGGASFTFLEDPRSYSDFSPEERRAALHAFAQSAPELRLLRIRFALIAQDIARIDAQALRIPEVVDLFERVQEGIPELVAALDVLAPFASVARAFSGLDADAQFLILYLNNAELRPGGGFIGAYSLMNIANGAVVHFSTEDSYSADIFAERDPAYHVEPPFPIKQYIGIPGWYFRDAAWSPSFFETAQDARQLLRQELSLGGQPIPDAHHILGITPDFIEGVLALVGPIVANGKTYTSENIYEVLQYDVEQGFVHQGIPYEERKTALKVISQTMLDRLLEMSPSSWMSFFTLFQDELEKKHVVFASTHEDTQAFLEDAGWAGTFAPAEVDDVLMLVDANMGALKTDPVVDRTLEYVVEPFGNGYRATTAVTYAHRGVADYKTGKYRTYAQLFVPQGATLVDTSGLSHEVIVTDALGMTSFATFLEVDFQETITLYFTYDLPDTVTRAIGRGVYTLGTFKQVGAGDNLLTLRLDFGTNLVAADPQEDPQHYGDAVYEYTTELRTDTLFRITL